MDLALVREAVPEGESPREGVEPVVRVGEALGEREEEGLPDALPPPPPPPPLEGVGVEEGDLPWVREATSVTDMGEMEGVRVGLVAFALLDTVGESVEA